MRPPVAGNAWLFRIAALCALPALITALAATVTMSAAVARLDASLVGGAVAADVDPLTGWLRSLTTLANTDVILAVTALAVALCAALRHWRAAVTVGLAFAVSQATVAVVKALIERPRPEEAGDLAHASGFSFPSGHAATAVAVYAVLALIAARGLTGLPRFAAACIGALAVVAIGASRVYLGVHYPTDVVAGWLTGGVIALSAWWATERITDRRRRAAA